jgi:transposase
VARLVKKISFSSEDKLALELGYRQGSSHCFRSRCQIILLKSSGYKSKAIGLAVGCCEMSVNKWIKRFEQKGLEGLKTQPGRGRKPILVKSDLLVVREAVQKERQKLSLAKKIIEDNVGKQMSSITLTRFLKAITADINE